MFQPNESESVSERSRCPSKSPSGQLVAVLPGEVSAGDEERGCSKAWVVPFFGGALAGLTTLLVSASILLNLGQHVHGVSPWGAALKSSLSPSAIRAKAFGRDSADVAQPWGNRKQGEGPFRDSSDYHVEASIGRRLQLAKALRGLSPFADEQALSLLGPRRGRLKDMHATWTTREDRGKTGGGIRAEEATTATTLERIDPEEDNACSKDESFRSLLTSCAQLRMVQDGLSSMHFSDGLAWRRGSCGQAPAAAVCSSCSDPSAVARKVTQLSRHLEIRCGLHHSAVGAGSMARVRKRELSMRCARGGVPEGSVRQAHSRRRSTRDKSACGGPCGACGVLEDFSPLDKQDVVSLSSGKRRISHSLEEAVMQREPQLQTVWAVWRRGQGLVAPLPGPSCPSSHGHSAAPAGSTDAPHAGGAGGSSWQHTDPVLQYPLKESYLPLVASWNVTADQLAALPNLSRERVPVPIPEWAPRGVRASILLQYFKQPDVLAAVVASYARCVKGVLRKGATDAVDVGVELLASVDQPSEARKWVRQWRTLNGARRRNGGDSRFLLVMFQHNLHEIRGYNTLARAARGDLLILTQDDDLAPSSCMWLPRNLLQVAAHPRTAGVAGWGSLKLGGARMQWILAHYPWLLEWDRATGELAAFVENMDIGPMAVLRCAWAELGGFDEAFSRPGQSGIISDWQFSQRLWMAGYRAVTVWAAQELGLIKSEAKSKGGSSTHVEGSKSHAIRKMNNGLNSEFMSNLLPFEDYVYFEVARISQLMRPLKHLL